MLRHPTSARTRAWAAYAAAMLVFGVLALALLYEQHTDEEALTRTAAEQELHLLSLAVHGDLELAQYQAAAGLISDWGRSGRQIIDLTLLTQNGQTLAEFHRTPPATEGLRLSTAVEYSYDSRAIIKIHYDVEPSRNAQRRFATGVIGLYLLMALTTAILMRLALDRLDALKKLRRTTEELDNYFNNALDLFLIGSDDGRARKLNPRWEEVLGYPAAEIEGQALLRYVHPDDVPASRAVLARLARGETITDFTNRLRHADGSYRSIEWVIRRAGKSVYAAARDVTARERQEEEIRFLTRIYSTLSETNQHIVRCTDERTLFADICRIAVDFGGMKLAWIGKEDANGRIRPIATYGERKERLADLQISSRADVPEGQGPGGIAFRERQAQFINDFRSDPRLAYWRGKQPEWTWGSFCTIPIRRGGGSYALMNFYDTVPHSFSGKIVDLLTEMAMDIEFALARLDLEAHKRAADDELRIAAIAFETPESMIVTDADGRILRVNAAFTQTTGYTQDEVLGRNPSFLQSGRHTADFFAEMWQQANATGRWQGEIWDRRKNGEVYPKWLTVSSVRDHAGQITHYVGSFTDISERKEAAAAISRLAFYDSLTSLPNRNRMMEHLNRALRVSSRSGKFGAVLFLDLDNFKTINDTLGHDEGDKLLQEAARRLRACVREEDTVARFGGDEFVVLLEDLGASRDAAGNSARQIADKLLAALAKPYLLNGKEYLCSASIGITLWRGDAQSEAHELLKRSDMAMYEAKKAGRNARVFFDPVMQTAIENRARLEGRLRAGLNLGQFRLFCQQQVNAQGSVLGAEALLRWLDPERGMVSPAEFIPLAEESDLIMPIGHWVLQAACRQIKAWAAAEGTRHLHLSVNISPKQFGAEWFVTDVADILRETGADPARLQLEITEGMLLTNIEDTIDKMTKLRKMGVTFALDDFGTGYSSLSYLQRLPLNVLKIDRSFVRELGSDPRSEAIVRTIIQMGQSLGLDVLAEGVETQSQRQLLARWGCTNYQGFLFAQPVPIDTFARELAPPVA
jgi:diguanylate cyclase (GGDEF)-like protein/PAS domain S-box-containing protein